MCTCSGRSRVHIEGSALKVVHAAAPHSRNSRLGESTDGLPLRLQPSLLTYFPFTFGLGLHTVPM